MHIVAFYQMLKKKKKGEKSDIVIVYTCSLNIHIRHWKTQIGQALV